MSNAIFPTFPGLAWSVYKTPEWSTSAQRAVSGKEIRMANRARPVWLFSLSYEILRGASVLQEYQKLLAFYNARQGSFDSFLFNDTSDNTATAQVIGTGDGVRTSWPLTHQIDTWSEPVGYAPSPTLYVNGTATYSVARTNLLKYSEQFDASVWVKNAAGGTITVTANAGADPFGGQTADQIVFSTSNQDVTQPTSVGAGTICSGSCWIKGTAGQTISIATVGANQLFTLDGTWQRLVTPNNTASNTIYSIHTYGGATARTIFAWGAQLEAGPVVTNYMQTMAAPATLPAGVTSPDGVNVTFSTPPPAGATITWSGTFYYRMRFDKDTMEFEQFMRDFWALKKCDLRGVI